MWSVPDGWRSALAGSHRVTVTATVTLSGRRLATLSDDQAVLERVPGAARIDHWSVAASVREAQVESRLTLSVADQGSRLLTLNPESPLQCYGQRLHVQATVHSANTALTIPLGVWRIDKATPEGGWWRLYPGGQWVRPDTEVSVEGGDLIDLLADYDFLGPSAIPPGSTRWGELRRLVDGTLPVSLSAADRQISPSRWEGSRLDAILSLLRDAGRVAWVDRAGVLRDLPAAGGTDTLHLAAADPDTGLVPAGGLGLVEFTPEASRDRMYNGVRATGSGESGAEVSGADWITDGPMAWDASGFGRVTYGYHSSLLRHSAQCLEAARTRLANIRAQRSIDVMVMAMPDLAIDPLDRVAVTIPDTGQVLSGPITELSVSAGEPMKLKIAVPAEEVIRLG